VPTISISNLHFAPGLHHDDCLNLTDDVQEALRRLPEPLVDERNFRINRAMQLSMSKITLPKAEWVKFEEVGVHSLQPFQIAANSEPLFNNIGRTSYILLHNYMLLTMKLHLEH
jgi:hypothetical protein